MSEKTKKTKMSKDQRRNQIIEAAMTVFVEKGFVGSTTAEIAHAAGISEVTLFRYFSSKLELFLEGTNPILFGSLKESIENYHTLDTKNRLERLITERIAFIKKNREVIKLVLKEANLLEEFGSGNYIEKTTDIIKKLLHQLKIPIKDEEYTLRLIMGTILSFLYMPDTDQEHVNKYVRNIASLLLN